MVQWLGLPNFNRVFSKNCIKFRLTNIKIKFIPLNYCVRKKEFLKNPLYNNNKSQLDQYS